MATYVNDLRLKEIATGDESGSWGTSTNTNLELIAEAFSFGTEAITTNADTHTTTIADGSTDPGRSIFLKYTGTLDSTCTITIGPNTISKLWFIENATSGSQSIIIKQGSGATITIANGQTKAIYSDGAGSGGAMVDAFTDLSVPSFFVSGDLDVDGTTNLDVVDIDGAVDFASTTTHAGNASFADNAKAIFGAGSDLQIFHDGSTSIITDQGTGFLALRGDGNVSLQNADGTENKLVASTDGAVTLYHDNSAKLATTSTGIIVGSVASGTSTSTPVELNLGSTFADSAGSLSKAKLKLFEDSSANVYGLSVSSGLFEFGVPSSAGYAFFINESEKMRLTGTGLGVGTSSPDAKLQVESSGTYVVTASGRSINGIDIQGTAGGSGAFAGGISFGVGATGRAAIAGLQGGSDADLVGLAFFNHNSSTGSVDASEAMRILANGTLLVGKTADDNSVGFKTNTSSTNMVASGQTPTFINRLSDDGDMLEFRKDSSDIGSIGSYVGTHLRIGNGTANLLFVNNTGILPATSSGTESDGILDLGASDRQFKDLYLDNVMYSGSARIATTTANSGGKIQVKTFSGGIFQIFQNSSGTTIGYIGNVSDSSTLYSTSSDQRLKENILDAPSASNDIDAIQVRSFDWKADGSHQKYGMVAQELLTVAPEAVSAPEDPDEMMGVDYSKLVPMLIKEIQSLRARVAQLETED